MKKGWWRHAIICALGLVFSGGSSPIGTWLVAQGVQKSSDSAPFDVALEIPKFFFGILILAWMTKATRPTLTTKRLISGAAWAVPCSLALMLPALLTGFVRVDVGFAPSGELWILNNLLLVCWGEEMFFRGYVQEELGRLFRKQPLGQWITLGLSALIFGLAHFRGGATYMALSTLAGLFFGLSYRSGGIPAAIATHFLLNLTHFLFFSYPGLAQQG